MGTAFSSVVAAGTPLIWMDPKRRMLAVSLEDADRKALAADQTFGHASRHRHLEKLPQQIAVAEVPMPVLR